MTNPYEPPRTAVTERPIPSRSRRHVFAGVWLSIASVFNLVAMNFVAGNRTFASFDWSAVFLVALGLLVLLRFRLAIVLARLVGLMAVVGLALAVLLMVTGFSVGDLTHGTTIPAPARWQVWAYLLSIAVTLLPPWWALHWTFEDDYPPQRSSG